MDRIPGKDPQINSKGLRFLENYWYHYKWRTLIALFIVITVVIVTFQMCSKEDVDVYVMYGGPFKFSGDEYNDFVEAFDKVMPRDFSGDGKKTCELVALQLMTAEEISAEESKAAAVGEKYYYDSYVLSQEQNKFNSLIIAGEYSICLLDPAQYQTVLEADGFLPLKDIFGSNPENALDNYGIELSKTAFYSYFKGVSVLPEDTVLCFQRKGTLSSMVSKKKTDTNYEIYLEMFKAIVNFGTDTEQAG